MWWPFKSRTQRFIERPIYCAHCGRVLKNQWWSEFYDPNTGKPLRIEFYATCPLRGFLDRHTYWHMTLSPEEFDNLTGGGVQCAHDGEKDE